ncbi:M23 family metallopeptidase [Burkholderia cepacia]|uniref:M23 family peptidase n=2 Tax=Burkholderia cepacia TaxID=292 RepID=A0ABN5CN64_BURCE|nr:M23 family metallopeptidase [Burkholderia cepacia]AIO22593.1 peptidase M23 family protein [Burkholderia cepacia ATCC 25416]ALK19325.1 hypothetical protein APZ15_16795 [Burkholderia cepacia ATCC 25416]ATF76626.1 M23 family peptidase [Burkholderia cepacia]MCA8467526.1 M23 family metallopeptidase [Burkholderia cepacia]MDN7763543.1 M23 family metallopeptidase [Burkholderia cepacia]
MLVSFPFLRVPKPRTDDDQNDGTFGLGEKSGKGAFPVSHQFGWHGGVHLVAPGGDANPEPVRAIADGEIVYARPSAPKPKTTPTGEERDANPLYYYAGWTSNGVVILKHRTEIGEGVEVVFYSIYQHLSTVAKADWKSGDKVYRKDPIGKAGDIYGKSNRIHFEIVADKANVERLMGRSEGKLEVAEGRRSCVWGDMHIVIPAGVPLYAVNPRTETRKYVVRAFNSTVGAANDTLESVAQRFRTTPARILALNGKTEAQAGDWWPKVTGAYQIAMASATKRPPLPTDAQRTIRVPAVYGAAAATPPDDLTAEVWAQWTVQPIGRTREVLIVTLSEARGDITLITRDVTGERRGNVSEPQGGYNLYKTAVDTYPGCPSAGYEMLRFGRILGPDAPAATDLHEGRLPHFRKIALDGSTTAFVDLNCAGTKAYSDADFPHWQGWTFIDDDTDGNSRCDSMQLLDLIEPRPRTQHPVPEPGSGEASQGVATVIDAATQHRGRLIRAYAKAQTGEMRERLSYCVVKMPSEWAGDDFDTRWDWLKGVEGQNPVANILFPMCLGDPAYERLKRHHQALAFWEDAVAKGLTLDKEHYHFHPMKFIRSFCKCRWLSDSEMRQLLPMDIIRQQGASYFFESPSMTVRNRQSGLSAEINIATYRTCLNLMHRKYAIDTPERMAAFYANATQETWWLQKLHEMNRSERYSPWDGRGFLQLTWPENYIEYWAFRGRRIDDGLKSRLRTAVGEVQRTRNNVHLTDAIIQMPENMIVLRDAVATNPDDATQSAGVYWSWMGASRYADATLPLQRGVARTNAGEKAYYFNESFRKVGASINYPRFVDIPGRTYNGYVDRCTSYANALVVLADDVQFPQPDGTNDPYPQDFRRRCP